MALVYSRSRELFLSPLFQWSLLLLYAVVMIVAAAKRPPYERAEATRAALVAYLLVSLSYYVYYYFLFEVLDPELYQLQSELYIANARAYGLTEPGSLNERLEDKFAPQNLRLSLTDIAFSMARGAVLGAAVSYALGFLLGVPSPKADSNRGAV